jgi:hypothetical protein
LHPRQPFSQRKAFAGAGIRCGKENGEKTENEAHGLSPEHFELA